MPLAAIAPFKGTGKRGRPAKVAQGVIGNGIRIVDGMALINLTGSREPYPRHRQRCEDAGYASLIGYAQ